MPRRARVAPDGMVYRVINRGVGKQKLFFSDDDYLALERGIAETLEKRPMQLLRERKRGQVQVLTCGAMVVRCRDA